MPLEVNSTDANHALQNIESFIQKYLEVLRYTESLPYEASAAHKDTFTTLYERLKPYDASINLSITDRRSYTDLTHREGAMFHQTLMFCELIFFDRIQWNNKTIGKFDEFKKHFVFSKSQLSTIRSILEPLAKNHQLMYVFSELSEITNDIPANDHTTISESNYIIFGTTNHFTNAIDDLQSLIDDTSTNPMSFVIKFINDPVIIREIAEYPTHHDVNMLPALTAKVEARYNTSDIQFTTPAILYLEHITKSPEIK